MIAAAALLIVAIMTNAKAGSLGRTTADTASHPAATTAAATGAAAAGPLKCQVSLGSKRPRDHTRVVVRVRTAAHAKVTVTSRLAPKHVHGTASVQGTWSTRLRVGKARPGARFTVTVHASSHAGTAANSTATCKTTLRPRPAATHKPPAAKPLATKSPAGSPSSAPAPTPTQPVVASSSAPAPASCYPISDEGTCYEPGEYCRDDDHGMSGIAGDGKQIVCEDNDGWRWEPV